METVGHPTNPKEVIVSLCKQMYNLGWVSGTGGGISIFDRESKVVYMAPSGVQKERIRVNDIFELSADGAVLKHPSADEGKKEPYKVSACAPLFFNAFNIAGAGACIHSHSSNAFFATLIFEDEFVVTELEMIKGIAGHGYYDHLRIPIIPNTAHECDLADSMAEAMRKYPKSPAVLVKRHGVYIWGADWVQAKTHAECLDYLFEVAVKMKSMGMDASKPANDSKRKEHGFE